MTDRFCGGCGATLDGRFCGGCGADSSTLAPVGSAPTPPPFASAAPTLAPTMAPSPSAASTAPLTPVAPDEFPPIGELYSSAWSSMKEHMADWLVATVLSIVLIGAVIALNAMYEWSITKSACRTCSFTVRDPIPFVDALLGILTIIAGLAIRAAFTRTALTIARGERINAVAAWAPKRLLPFAVFELIAQTLWFAGWLVPFVGPIAVVGLIMYAPFAVLEGSASGVTGLWRSLSMTATRARFGSQFGFAFLQTLLFFVAYAAFFLLLIWVDSSHTNFWSSTPKALFALAALATAGVAVVITGITVISAAATAYVRLDDRS